MISKLCAFAAFAYLARVLGPGDFGQLEFALAITFFFTLLVDCGLSGYGAREIAKDGDAVTRFTVHIILIRCLLAVVAFTLLAIGIAIIDKPWAVKKLILLYGVTLFALPGLLPFVFQGRDLMHYVALASVIRWSLFAVGVLLLVQGPSDTWIVALIEIAALGCVVVFYVGVFWHYFGSLHQRIDYRFTRSIFHQALPIGASELLWALKIYFATVLLGLLGGGPEVGWFGAAHRIVISLHTFVWLYFFNLLPSIARCTQGPMKGMHRLMQTSLQVTAWLAVFLGIVGTAFAEPIITLIYGSQYNEAVAVFGALIWLIPLALMSGHFRYALIGYNKQGLEFLSSAYGACANILLNLLLIPSAGLVGAAWALLISEVVIWGFAYCFVRRTITHVPICLPVIHPLVGGAIAAGVLYLLPPVNIWVAGSSAVAVYCFFVAATQPKVFAHVRSMFVGQR
ncbi:MAG: flippase [Gammaproteobacteria bacterium]|nr:flippase [Gammaproteobacteria bacterium]